MVAKAGEVITKERYIKKLEVAVFKMDGKPTCAINLQKPSEGVCRFLGLVKLGTTEVCRATGLDVRMIEREVSPDGGFGRLIPVETCPFWGKDD